MTFLANPIAISMQTPRTRDQMALRAATRARLQAVEIVVCEFVLEKEVEGFSVADINKLYAVELPLLSGYRIDPDRWPAARTPT